ncbi:hypothetical protein Sjap_008205 [Stephania japonica]|uniref:Uncharacterized protein n=1 Tax=Stephania japonica TaxID=461633 RepID=A0AAP0JPW1_9MAGN
MSTTEFLRSLKNQIKRANPLRHFTAHDHDNDNKPELEDENDANHAYEADDTTTKKQRLEEVLAKSENITNEDTKDKSIEMLFEDEIKELGDRSKVEACDFCREYFHPTYVCPYHQSNSSSQPDIYSSMWNQPSRDIIRYCLATMQDMKVTEQELDQWDQEAEEEIKSILQKISAETMSAIPLESVELNEVTPVEDYWSEPEETIEVSLYVPDIIIAQNEVYEVEKEIDVILERPEELQKESKED